MSFPDNELTQRLESRGVPVQPMEPEPVFKIQWRFSNKFRGLIYILLGAVLGGSAVELIHLGRKTQEQAQRAREQLENSQKLRKIVDRVATHTNVLKTQCRETIESLRNQQIPIALQQLKLPNPPYDRDLSCKRALHQFGNAQRMQGFALGTCEDPADKEEVTRLMQEANAAYWKSCS